MNRTYIVRSLVPLTAALVLLSGGCSDPVPGGPAAEPRVTEARVEPNPNNVLSAVVTARVEEAEQVAVEYTADTARWERTPPRATAGGEIRLPLLGLAPSTPYHVRVVATDAAGRRATSAVLRYTTGALPAGIPELAVTTAGRPSDGYVMLGFTGSDPAIREYYALIVDNAGAPVWYRRFASQVADFQKQPNGNYTVFSSLGGAPHFYELDPLGNVVREYAAANGLETGAHELRLRDDGYVLYGFKDTVMDLSRYGGNPAALVKNLVIEYNRTGGGGLMWNAAAHIEPDEVASDMMLSAASVNPWHSNAMDVDTDGNLLISFRNSDMILKVDSRTGEILWRLGGRKNQFTFLNDPLGGFSHQHGIRRLPSGNIILFDNGNLHTPPVSRAVEYRIDEAARTAELVWEYRHDPPLYAFALGFAQRQASGHTLVCYGTLGHVVEVDGTNAPQWELRTVNPAYLIYRAFRIGSIY